MDTTGGREDVADTRKTRPQLNRVHREHWVPGSPPVQIYRQTLRDPVELHWHEFYEVVLVLSGEGTHIFNGSSCPLTKGSVYLLTPADFHELWPAAGQKIELYNLVFSEEMLGDELGKLLFSVPNDCRASFSGPQLHAIGAEFRRLWSEFTEPRPAGDLVIRSTLQRMLVDIGRTCESRGSAADNERGKQGGIWRALNYIHHHFREPLTLEEVARRAPLSPNYFSECFHRVTGSPFQTYLQAVRLRFAMSLLAASDLSVTDVCYASGFNSLSHFDRAFKQKYGRSPRFYRRRYQDQR